MAAVRGLRLVYFAKHFSSSADGGVFTPLEIAQDAGISDPEAMSPQDVDKAVAFDLALNAISRESIGRISENQQGNRVIVLTNGAAQHPPEAQFGLFAEFDFVARKVRRYENSLRSVDFSAQPDIAAAIQKSLVNEAVKKGVPIIFARSTMGQNEHHAVAELRGRGHEYIEAEHLPIQTAGVSADR